MVDPLDRISNILLINGHFIDRPGLDGKFGVSIFLYHYYELSGQKRYKLVADQLLAEIKDLSSNTNCGFNSGLSGIGFGTVYLNNALYLNDNVDEVLLSLDAKIHNFVINCNELAINELCDVGIYLVARLEAAHILPLKSLFFKELIIHLLDKIESAFVNKTSLNWNNNELVQYLKALLFFKKQKVLIFCNENVNKISNEMRRKFMRLGDVPENCSYIAYLIFILLDIKNELFYKLHSRYKEMMRLKLMKSKMQEITIWDIYINEFLRNSYQEYAYDSINDPIYDSLSSEHDDKYILGMKKDFKKLGMDGLTGIGIYGIIKRKEITINFEKDMLYAIL